MKIFKRKTLINFYSQVKYASSKDSLEAWFQEVNSADWENGHDIKKKYPSASFVGNDRVVFNIKGNDYRLIVKIQYKAKFVFIRFVGTHEEYNIINAKEV
jgi:mRNA interferase HigB